MLFDINILFWVLGAQVDFEKRLRGFDILLKTFMNPFSDEVTNLQNI